MSVAANLARIRDTIGCSEVRLVAVTKNVAMAHVEEAFKNGVTEFGENRVLDAVEKQNAVPPYMADKIRWHFIGHLQTNKVKKVVGNFALIHSVDSLRLAEEISREAQKRSIEQPILLQVKVVEDNTKSGFSPEELKAQFETIRALPNLKIEGLMTMAPFVDDQNVWRQCFNGAKQLRDELETAHGVKLKELSMGMSDDFQEAVRCGATMVRLGRAVFGTG
jgi:PLP dependent protein